MVEPATVKVETVETGDAAEPPVATEKEDSDALDPEVEEAHAIAAK